ncbi:MAG: glycoside hydrolase family 27 protein, partial [Planctomycetes bacterium]|nr:glycoside hydrolase family 27 protein [Planctomycetota bacterium]
LMREAAETMVKSGMADSGYQYINIDDCWMNADDSHWRDERKGPFRDEHGNIICNKFFPDMYSLTEYIHSFGLRAGIYTSPGPLTCGKYAGSYQHEQQDVDQFVAWGFDFLKYDWCSYSQIAKDDSLAEMQKPYILMGDILEKADRDIILNLCQYGMGQVWKWGEKVGGQCWRTSGDLGFELTNYHTVARNNAKHKEYAHPGSWNDPDYLIIGMIGRRSKTPEERKCPLTPNEQYSYMSLWCLMASPLFFSGDMGELDDFTLNILCNTEVIEIDQDPLGKQGYPVIINYETEIWKKELYDGSIAVGMFNRAEIPQKITFSLKDLNLKGRYKARDLWRQKNLGTIKDSYSAKVPRHGVKLLRLFPK